MFENIFETDKSQGFLSWDILFHYNSNRQWRAVNQQNLLKQLFFIEWVASTTIIRGANGEKKKFAGFFVQSSFISEFLWESWRKTLELEKMFDELLVPWDTFKFGISHKMESSKAKQIANH